MEKMNLLARSVASICAMNIISAEPGKVDQIMATPNFNAENVEIKLIINGVECMATKTLEEMWEVHEKEVTRRAEELIESRMNGVMYEAQRLSERMKDLLPWHED